VRRASGGAGRQPGGDGVRRSLEFLSPAHVSILSEHRHSDPFGLDGGEPGARGQNLLNGKPLPGAASFDAQPGDVLTLLTPGGGGYGSP
jgi:N-methylhydantoinase B